MKMLTGSMFVFTQSYKRQITIFWSILLCIIAISFMVAQLIKTDITIFISFSVPVYVFFVILGTKVLTKTFNYFLRFGMSRTHYLKMVGVIFIALSTVSALFLVGLHALYFQIVTLFNMKTMFILHPIYWFDETLPLHLIFIADVAALLFSLVIGLIANYIFYRFGTIGGYSAMGLLGLLIIVALPLEWYSKIYEHLTGVSFIMIYGGVICMSILLYSLMTMAVQKLPAVSVTS